MAFAHRPWTSYGGRMRMRSHGRPEVSFPRSSLVERVEARTRHPSARGWDRRGPSRRRGFSWPTIAAIAVAGATVGGVAAVLTDGSDDGSAPDSASSEPTSTVAQPVVPAPRVDVPAEVVRAPGTPTVVVRGLIDDAVSLTVDGRPMPMVGGWFTAEVAASAASVVVRAVDAAGSATERTIAIVDVATPVSFPPTRAVHIAADDWADPTRKAEILALIEQGRIDAVQLDIKDESGEVGHLSRVPLAVTAGSVRAHYDAKAATDELHALGVRVIGRIVCFLDPVVASHASKTGNTEMLVLTPDGQPFRSGYGDVAFTNFANPAVQAFLIELAVEAGELGFDEILYDYVRRPEGKESSMVVPGLDTPAAVAVARFVRDTKAALEPLDVELGVSVFGVSATRPKEVAQDIRLLAPHVDYVSPMVYPSHWGPGEYGVDDPSSDPAAIVERSVADFVRVAAGSGAAVVPWLQAFSEGGVEYGPAQVRAQIDASARAGAEGFLLWNARSVYDADALEPVAAPPTAPAATTVVTTVGTGTTP